MDHRNPALGLIRVDKPVIDLPFEFELRREAIRQIAKEAIHTTEEGRSVPNWSIRTRSGHVLCPDTKHRKSEFLLVSRIPNWREERDRHKNFKNTVTMFGGTHGVGTSALRLLYGRVRILASPFDCG